MLILAIDTSGKQGGITLAQGDRSGFGVIESAPIAGGTFSAQLVPTLATVLENHGLKPAQIEGFAVASGPGSFTGLRVGLSAIKGLAEILRKPIAAVSLLEALASLSYERGLVAAALDAGRMEIYFGLYDLSRGRPFKVREQLLSAPEFVNQINASGAVRVVTSDHALAESATASNIPVQEAARPGSEMVARIGLQKLLEGETITVEALDANYIRRSDAEINLKAI